jgi:hypothetical protein
MSDIRHGPCIPRSIVFDDRCDKKLSKPVPFTVLMRSAWVVLGHKKAQRDARLLLRLGAISGSSLLTSFSRSAEYKEKELNSRYK